MPNIASAKKRMRQDLKRRSRNRWRLRAVRISMRTLAEKLQHGSYEEAQDAFRATCRILDKTAQKGVIHKNTAARTKSRLSRRVKAKSAAA